MYISCLTFKEKGAKHFSPLGAEHGKCLLPEKADRKPYLYTVNLRQENCSIFLLESTIEAA
jgi:hypothetical protein